MIDWSLPRSLIQYVGRFSLSEPEPVVDQIGVYRRIFTISMLLANDAGDYSCEATVSHASNSRYIDDGKNSSSMRINIESKWQYCN